MVGDDAGVRPRLALVRWPRRVTVNRRWALATLMFAVATLIFGTTAAYLDRGAMLVGAEERTQSLSRMIAAHADASIAQARSVLDVIDARTTNWDFDNSEQGARIFVDLASALAPFPALASAWIVDAEGLSRFDTWSFPARPVVVTDRPYFQAHAARDGGDVLILGDEVPGSITGQPRFTVSRARRDDDGTLLSVTVVAIYTQVFDTLYEEAASWPGARGGLYSLNGEILARSRQPQRASAEFLARLGLIVEEEPAGTAILSDHGEARVVSWRRLANTPALFATSSQTVSAALAEWRRRTIGLGAISLAAIVLFALFARSSARAARAEEAARYHALAIKEVHHRVRNALALLIAMVRIQAREQSDSGPRAELTDLAERLQTVAEIETLLVGVEALDEVDVAGLLDRLAKRLDRTYGGAVRFTAEGETQALDTSVATTIAIAANELITNALKHGGKTVSVAWRRNDESAELSVASDGPPLPPDFDVAAVQGFGLRMVQGMAAQDGGSLAAENIPGGTRFVVRWPAAALG